MERNVIRGQTRGCSRISLPLNPGYLLRRSTTENFETLCASATYLATSDRKSGGGKDADNIRVGFRAHKAPGKKATTSSEYGMPDLPPNGAPALQ